MAGLCYLLCDFVICLFDDALVEPIQSRSLSGTGSRGLIYYHSVVLYVWEHIVVELGISSDFKTRINK